MTTRLLLLADTSSSEALGSKLLQGAAQAGLAETDVAVAYLSAVPTFSPSMARLRGKVFYRLADRRSWEWWGFQRQLLQRIELLRPRLILVTGILPLDPAVFAAVHRQGGTIVNYLTDDPWNPNHRRRSFLSNLADYDHIFSTKQALQGRLRAAGATSTSWLPFAYDPTLHRPPSAQPDDAERFAVDVAFVGTGAGERLPWLAALADVPGLRRRIYGNSWQGLTTPGWEQHGAVTGETYARAISGARLVLGLLRQASGMMPTVSLTEEGLATLRERRSVRLTKPRETPKVSVPRTATSAGAVTCDEVLFEKLRRLRKRLADEQGVPPYIVFGDVSLRHMARDCPTTEREFLAVPGVGETKLRVYGDEFLAEIEAHVAANGRAKS